MAKEYSFSDIFKKITAKTGKIYRRQHNEINLVPDIKGEMIKSLKLRNFIFFLCIVVAAASVGVTALFGAIAGGQQLAISNKKQTIENLSGKLKSYGDLSDFLTIKDQLSNLSDITSNKKVLSRTFNVLSALLPTGADYIRVSELNVDLSGDSPVFAFDAQANAGRPPYIDYNVLDSFKKSMKYMRYDYGEYVDKYGATIPAYCIIETNSDGAFFADSSTRSIYAYWNITGEGCNPSATTEAEDSDSETSTDQENQTEESLVTIDGYVTEDYGGTPVVRIWRTPQFAEWYSENPTDGAPSIDQSGTISNVPHFSSSCLTYSAYDASSYTTNSDETVITTVDGLTWVSRNSSCLLVPDGDEGITISESSNGRDASDELVLRFSATITFAPEVYDFNNTHMLALAPSGRYNVTDSYVQIQAMFGERARDCAKDDAACKGGN